MSDLLLKPLSKPKLRGYLHHEAFFFFLGACTLLIAKSSTEHAVLASCIYSFGLLLLFGVSAAYHRPQWAAKARARMKRVDHAAIFILIAGTITPIAMISLQGPDGKRLLLVFWVTATFGVLHSIFWVRAPKWVTATLYVAAGWMAFPYLRELQTALGNSSVGLILAGGVAYTIGAVFYALKKPNIFPGIFGYHELFHLFTIIGAALHFVVIYRIV